MRSLALRQPAEAKAKTRTLFYLTQSYLYNPNDEQDQEIVDTIHMQDKFQVNVAL